LYISPDIIIKVMKSRRVRLAGHVVRMGDEKWSENLKGGDHAEDLRMDGRIKLE
jgi:hypothetical protein